MKTNDMLLEQNSIETTVNKIPFLIELNKLKNSLIASKDIEEQIKILCNGIIKIFNMSRVVFYQPLKNDMLHATYEFIKSDDDINLLKGSKVHSFFNPPRKIANNERMYLAHQHGYYIKLKDNINDDENTFILICIRDKEGMPIGYLKIEKDIIDSRYDKDLKENNGFTISEKNEIFVDRQRRLLSELQVTIERIMELANFVTLSTVKDPYCELNGDIYNQEKLKALEELISNIKSAETRERLRFIPDLIKLLDAESIELFSKSSHNIVKTICLWSKESEIPTPVYKSSFLQKRKMIANGDSMYFADIKGYDIVLDISSNPKCINMKELSNITSYIIVRMQDTMRNTIGFLKVNFIFRGDLVHLKFHSKLKKDLEMLKSVVPYLTIIPESEEFTHNSRVVLKNLYKLVPDLPLTVSDNDLIFHYISDILMVDISNIDSHNIPELIDNMKKFSYFVKDKKFVIHVFKWLYNVLDHRYKALIVSAIAVIFEHLTIEQGKDLSAFKDDCFDILSAWMKSEIKYIITSRHGLRYSVDILDQLLQLNCIFIAKYENEDIQRCTDLLEALNIYDINNIDFLFSLFKINQSMPGSYISEIFKSFYYLINNNLLNKDEAFEVLDLSLKILNNSKKDYSQIGQILSTVKIAFGVTFKKEEAIKDETARQYMDEFNNTCINILSESDNWLINYTTALLSLVINNLKTENRLDLTAFESFIADINLNNKEALLTAIRDFLISNIDSIILLNLDSSIKMILSKLKHGNLEVINDSKDILLLLGNHISSYERSDRSSNFMNILINELSTNDINYKLTIHDILHTLKINRMGHQSIHLDHDIHPIPQDSYISAVSSILGFSPFDIGDKGYHLLEIIGQCRIPVFLLLKTRAYDDFINHNNLGKEIIDILDSIGFDNQVGIEDRIVQAGENIFNLIMEGTMPEHMEIELIDKFIKFKEHVDSIDNFVTIGARSTAKGEDGRLYSFAGQFLTLLDIKSPGEFIAAIKKIWASLWAPKAISYRHDILEFDPSFKDRFSSENISMGVVIQSVVDAKTSGVIMTSSGGEMIVSGSFGLEGGTRSELAADKYTLNRHANITEKVISPQKRAICWDNEEKRFATKEIESPHKQLEQKIPDNQLKIRFEIVESLKKLPIFLGYPLDIEYAISADNTVYVTQIRPRTISFGGNQNISVVNDFSGFYSLNDKLLQTFTRGAGKGLVTVLNINEDETNTELEKIKSDSVVVARHLDLPNLEVYLKRRTPEAIILETCTPFAHPVLVVSEMEKQGKFIPVVQVNDALKIFRDGIEIGIEVNKENSVTFYAKDRELLSRIDKIKSPILYTHKDRLIKKKYTIDNLKTLSGSFEEIESDFILNGLFDNDRYNGIGEDEQIEVFKTLFLLSIHRQIDIENLIGEQYIINEEDLSEWYLFILNKFMDRESPQYEYFLNYKISPYIKKELLKKLEEKVGKNRKLCNVLRRNFDKIKNKNLWHPRELLFQLNAPVFIIDPRLNSNKDIHNPLSSDFNPWEFNIVLGAQNAIFHDQLGTLVPYNEKNRYIRGRVSSDPLEPNTVIDIGFLDNNSEYYDAFEERINALSKTAKILLNFNFHPTTQVEILPRMTDDFKENGINNRIRLEELSRLRL